MPTDCKKERVNGMNLPLDFPGQERESFNLAKHSFIPLEGNGASCVIRKGVWRTNSSALRHTQRRWEDNSSAQIFKKEHNASRGVSPAINPTRRLTLRSLHL